MADETPSEPPESERELVEQLQAELGRLKVSDLLLQTVYTISSLGYHRLSGENKDLDQARLAIEALKALVPVLEGAVQIGRASCRERGWELVAGGSGREAEK